MIEATFNIICRDNADSIIDCLNSTLPAQFKYYSICDTGSTDNTVALILEWGLKNDREIKVSYFEKEYGYAWSNDRPELFDFGRARQLALENTSTEYFVWIDTDDILENGQALPQILQQARESGIDQVLFPYRYGVDKYGNDVVSHPRERLIRLRDNVKWSEPVHEYVSFPDIPVTVMLDTVKWRHKRKPEHVKRTSRRNRDILRYQLKTLESQGVRPHLRLLQNLAYDHWEHREWAQAIAFYDRFFARYEELSATNQDRVIHEGNIESNLANLAKAHAESGSLDKAEEIFRTILTRNGLDRYTYLGLAELRLRQGRLPEAKVNLQTAMSLPIQSRLTVINEVDLRTRPYLLLAEIANREARFEDAVNAYDEILRVVPGSEEVARMKGVTISQYLKKQAFDGYIHLKTELLNDGDWSSLKSLLGAIPASIKVQEFIAKDTEETRQFVNKKLELLGQKVPAKKKIAFYTGNAFEDWSAKSLEGGIGGSETMVIELARELAALGNDVCVYNRCGDQAGEYDGVKYIDYKEYKPEMQFDVLVVSRIPAFTIKQVEGGLDPQLHQSKRVYLWLHDTFYGEIPKMAFGGYDRIFVLTDFHKQIIQRGYDIPDSKFWVTRNGIDVARYKALKSVERNPKQMIYASSYDRGLYEFLLAYKKVKEAVPDAKAKVYYGWNTYDKRMAQMPEGYSDHPSQMSMKEYKNRCVELMQETGVADGGRIGKDELFLETARSGIWYYETWFSEISCITAMVSQLAGAIPVCTPVAALPETVKAGFVLDGGHVEKTIELMTNDKLASEIREKCIKAGESFDIKSLAVEWNKFFEGDK